MPSPLLRFALLCSHYDPDPDGAPFSLYGPIHTVVMPLGGRPYRPASLTLYTQLEDAAGTFAFAVQVWDEREKPLNSDPPAMPVTFPPTRNRVIPHEQVFRVDVTFPGPGVYWVHLLCDGLSMHERRGPDDRPFPPARVNAIAEEGFRVE